MKKLSIFLILFILSCSAFAQVKFDTLASFPVGPGMVHTKLVAPLVPWAVNVLEIDLRNSYVSMETVKAQDRLTGFERTSSMASRKNYPGHYAVGAVNGDFYGTIPIGIQILSGEILRTPIDKSTLGFDVNKSPMINIVNFSGVVKRSAVTATLDGINQTRATNQLILYN